MSTITVTARPSSTAVYRLTRRGRVVVFLLAFLVLVAVAVVFAGGSMATSQAEATETLVVQPGQTLWEIAAGASDGRDVRDMMDHLVKLNHLDSVSLGAGQHLEVPVD